ncbi:MAG: hypothetical protein EA403_00395 [Spirochaetaceae bacterium]|nr:MAG: hypothetical protein EA403_00395 [Spirochaetaceae bacterium]
MSRSARHFLDLLDVELEDICADLREMEELMRTRIAASDLTEYVFQENSALLEFEIACISRLRIAIRNHAFEPDADIDAASAEVIQLCAHETRRMQMPFLNSGETTD